ncbi:hypothetical protein PCASD_09187 [Puccinia coronata f. sp. avenae]|uniref:CCHC-type domain-containing protein n=1 Tax=Puccinia coronata f. sp. avenae TaxID=200324 RepID=A0A2N5TGE3_9BASI|nr:hypothetical protein PCASD_09187 [Puccinia coronata f. sp. avenae]
MGAKLEDIGARKTVTGLLKIDEKTTAEEIAAYSVLNRKGYSKIVQNLDASNLALVSTTLPKNDCFNGCALWKLLKGKYTGSDLVAQSSALDHFLDLEFSNVGSFCSAIRLSNQCLVLANVLKDDQVKIMIMLRKLSRNQFQSFRDIIAMGFATETFELSVKRLESYAVFNNIKKEALPSSTTQATMMSTTTSTSKPAVLCLHCGKTGHHTHNCWVKYPEKAPKTKAAHLTVQDNYAQLADKSSSDANGHFTYFRTPNGNCYHLDNCKFENVKYF